MYSKLRLFELKNTILRQKHHFFIKLTKVLEVANFRFLANFKFLTLICLEKAEQCHWVTFL